MARVPYKKIESWMQARCKDIIEDIRTIVNIPSVSEPDSQIQPFGQNCRDVLDAMLAAAKRHGMDTVNYEYFCGKVSFSAMNTSTELSEIGIWTHLDVVPEGGGWNYPPFQMTEKEGFLIGRGVQDNKSCVIASLYAIKCISELSLNVNHRYSLYVGCSEENTMDDAAYVTEHYQVPEMNLVADCGFPVCFGEMGSITVRYITKTPLPENILSICGGTVSNSIPDRAVICFRQGALKKDQIQVLEKTADILVSRCEKGVLQIEVTGASAHIITPEQGKSAITMLARALENAGIGKRMAWRKFLCAAGQDGYGTGIGINRRDDISGPLVGAVTRMYMVNRKLHMMAEYRYPVLNSDGTQSDGKEVERRLKALGRVYYLDFVIEKHSKAVYHPPEDGIVKQLTASYHRYSGFDNPPYTMSGGTYARKLPGAMGFGMALPDKKILQPADDVMRGDYHQADESVCVEQILRGAAIFAACLAELE